MVAEPAPDMIGTVFMSEISRQIWDMKYRLKAAGRHAHGPRRGGQLGAGGAGLAEAEAPEQRIAPCASISPPR